VCILCKSKKLKLFLHYFKNKWNHLHTTYTHIYTCIKTEEWTSANHSFRSLVTTFQNAMKSIKSKNDKKKSSSLSLSALEKMREPTHNSDQEEETGLDLTFQGKLDAVAGGLSESSGGGLNLGGEVGGTGGLGDSLPLYWTAHFLVINPSSTSTSSTSTSASKDGFVLLKMKCDCVNIGCFDDEVKGKSLK
jgi:hypothetical protein